MSFRRVAKQHSPLSIAQAMLGRGPQRNKTHVASIETYFCSFLKTNRYPNLSPRLSFIFFYFHMKDYLLKM